MTSFLAKPCFLSNPVYRHNALVAAFAACLFQNAQAEPAKALDSIVVTANRSEVSADQVLASVTLITRQDIEDNQAPDLLNLLSRQAGVEVVRTGGSGQANSLFLRGSNSNQTLVLIDGIRVNASTQGVFDFAHLPLSQIERIEIVRGPRAALWGSDAIGGVIHIFTRDPASGYLEARAGSYGQAGLDAGFGAATDQTRFGLGAGIEHVRGFSATNQDAGPYVYDADNDGYRNRHYNLRAGTHFGTQELAFTGLITDADVEFDQGETAALNREFGLALSGKLSERWQHSLTLGHNSEDLNTPAFGSHFGSARDSLDWVDTLTLNSHNRVNLGLNWSRESGFSNDAFSGPQFDQSRRNAALFASWLGHFDAHTLELSLRHDDNSQFKGATTGNAAWGWQASEALRVRASWGQGFRAPNFNELYYPGFFGLYQGNPALRPERSNSTELGLDWQLAPHQSLGLSAYRTRISDLISFTGINNQAINIDRAAIDGIELQYQLQHGAWKFTGNAGWQDAVNDTTGEALLRRAPRKAHASVDYGFGNGFRLGLDGDAVAARAEMDFNVFPAAHIQLAGYGLLHLRAEQPLGRGWRLQASIENLFDRDYQLVSGYNTPGRSGLVRLYWDQE